MVVAPTIISQFNEGCVFPALDQPLVVGVGVCFSDVCDACKACVRRTYYNICPTMVRADPGPPPLGSPVALYYMLCAGGLCEYVLHKHVVRYKFSSAKNYY
jgi:hypothetical protein